MMEEQRSIPYFSKEEFLAAEDSYHESSIVRPVLDHYVLVSGGGVRVSDVTRGHDVVAIHLSNSTDGDIEQTVIWIALRAFMKEGRKF